MKYTEDVKRIAIDYANFRREVQKEEGRWAYREYKKSGGIFSWEGKSNQKIWEDFVLQRTAVEVCDATDAESTTAV